MHQSGALTASGRICFSVQDGKAEKRAAIFCAHPAHFVGRRLKIIKPQAGRPTWPFYSLLTASCKNAGRALAERPSSAVYVKREADKKAAALHGRLPFCR